MKMDKKSRNDKILIVSIVICAILFGIFLGINGMTEGTTVVVTVDGIEYGRYSILQEQEVCIGESNMLLISGQAADMRLANCPDQVCVKHDPVSKIGETIICLPNRVVITIESISSPKDTEDSLDVIVK